MAAITLLVTAIVLVANGACAYAAGPQLTSRAVAPVPPRRTLHPVTGAKTFWPLASFVVLAYAISWGWTFPFAAAGDGGRKGYRLAD